MTDIRVLEGWLEREGRPWLPVSGEIHYSRLPRHRWGEVLGHARAGGLDAVATYVFWNAHEPEPGFFTWEGNRDLRAFVQLAQHYGLESVVRIGPWAHGESRHGGFPDWLVERGLRTRTDDPAYLALVRPFYEQIAAQLEGLSVVDGGPVIGIQVENELYDQPEHLATLQAMARDCGIEVPLWTATGWGGAQVPPSLLAVYSGYADGFWEEADTPWPPFVDHHFRFTSERDDLSVGADVREAFASAAPGARVAQQPTTPFATCELGGGMHVAYHRRPLVPPEDVAALAMAKLGSGSVWQGYYMYAGGTQRVGPHGSEQESHATDYPNDVPALSYDFHAPIGEHGQVRAHHHLLRRQHLWLHADGHRLAAMTAQVTAEGSLESVRTDGRSAYLFLSTHGPAHRPLPARASVQVPVRLSEETVLAPPVPVDLPTGVSVAWPVNLPLPGGQLLRSASASLLTRVSEEDGTEVVVLMATDGVPAVLELAGTVAVHGPATTEHRGGHTLVRLSAPPGPECEIELPGSRVLVLDEASADRLYVLEVAGRERLVLSAAPCYAVGGSLVLHPDEPVTEVAISPPPGALAGPGVTEGATSGRWGRWLVHTEAGHAPVARDLHPEHGVAPVPRRGGSSRRLSAPTDYSSAAQVRVQVPPESFAAHRTLLRVHLQGDVARAWIGETLVSDHFWHGRAWDIDLSDHQDAALTHGVRLEILPRRAADGVWVDPSVRATPDGVTVAAVEILRVARVELTTEEAVGQRA
ncbi:beta-galactosidase [Ruania suaedae]|uniref:beta-galactosidase n=1 Tax=Ruania suaedae TaxID=2897774 RepID=UPI001E39946A|nr:beta-galactosidase [Ruania suaedae]UFU04367.1 beta-galactosidase [Ruania suaedae]